MQRIAYCEVTGLRFFFLLIILTAFFTLTGCVGTRYLEDDERLLYDIKIEGNKAIDEQQYIQLSNQQSNKRFPLLPFAPYALLYESGKENFDKEKVLEKRERVIEKYKPKLEKYEDNENKTARIERKREKKLNRLEQQMEEGNLRMRIGEPLTILDSTQTEETLKNIKQYLQNNGFFQSEVKYEIRQTYNSSNQVVQLVFKVKEGKPYRFDTVVYVTNDPTIDQILNINRDESFIVPGTNYSQDALKKERERLEALIRNNGYYDFSRQFIFFRVDTSRTGVNRGVKIETLIKQPEEGNPHTRFIIDSVRFVSNTDSDKPGSTGASVFYRNIYFQRYRTDVNSNTRTNKRKLQRWAKILRRRMFIAPDAYYSQSGTLETQRRLANLDNFRFVNVLYDTTGSTMVARITAEPLKKYSTSNEVGLNAGAQIFGPFFNSSIKVRNVFGGLEIMEISARAGIEGVPTPTDVSVSSSYQSLDVRGTMGITFPQFVVPLTTDQKLALGRLNPKTRLTASYTYQDIPDFTREMFNVGLTYSWQNTNNTIFYTFTPVDLSLVNSFDISQAFQERLAELGSRNLERSFEPSFVSSAIFTSILNFNNYATNSNTESRKASFLRLLVEGGGTFLNFSGQNYFAEQQLETFQFVKTSFDLRNYSPLTKNTILAWRLRAGVAVPYGEDRTLPYEKFFFAGGSSSIRSWLPRRLGPGTYTPDTVDTDGYLAYSIEQPGEILLESSVELRRNLFSYVDGALFVDAGNIWTIRQDPGRPGSQITADFFRNIAVGAGLGLRIDFSYLIVRVDSGIKIYDPARPRGERLIGKQFSIGKELTEATLNIGIGYPF